VLSQFTRLTDRWTEQTDSFLIAIPCLHCMQRGKNYSLDYIVVTDIVRLSSTTLHDVGLV